MIEQVKQVCFSSAPWPSDPVTNTVRVVWSEEKGKLIRADSIEGPGDLKKKFDDAMQSNLGEMLVQTHSYFSSRRIFSKDSFSASLIDNTLSTIILLRQHLKSISDHLATFITISITAV